MLLRPRQQTFVERTRAALAERGNTLGVAPTGTGKTVMLSACIEPRKERTLVLQHRDELVAQNRKTFHRYHPGTITGVVDARDKHFDRPVVFAMVQTLARPASLERLRAFDLLAIDEAHHAAAGSWRAIIERCRELNPQTRVLGLTATPNRADKKSLRDVFDNVSDQITLAELIAAGNLVRPRTLVIDLGVREALAGVRRTAMDFDMEAVEAIMDKRPLNDAVVKHWQEHAADRLTVAFASTVRHATDVAQAFTDAGVPAAIVTGEMAEGDRKNTLARFERGEIRVLVNVAVLTEGWDCLDDATEVLTPTGWRGRGQIKPGDAVYGYDCDKAGIEECVASDVGERPVRPGEQMLEIKSQHVDLRVTEGHRMFAIRARRGGLREVLARDLAAWTTDYSLPLSGFGEFPGVPLSDDELRLIAWHITDGYLTKGGRLEIYQAVHKHAGHINDLIRRLGLRVWSFVRENRSTQYRQTSPLETFVIGKRQLARVAAYLDKDISPLLDGMNRHQFRVFWSELLLGDGEGDTCLCTGRKSVADRLNQMAVLRGFASSTSVRVRPAGTSYRVFVRDKQLITSSPQDPRSASMSLQEATPGETVWCVTNRLGTIITRRKGKIAIVGNCQPVSCVILLRPSSHKSTMIQMIGRGLRPVDPERFPGVHKHDCIVMDFGTACLTHGNLEQDVDLEARPKPKGAAPTRQCPECGGMVPLSCQECPLCLHEFPPPERDMTNGGELRDFRLIEVDLLASSPYRWEDIWDDGSILVASAFDSWAIAVWYHGQWHAVGGTKGEGVRHLAVGERLMAVAAADDYLREHGDRESAAKSRSWLNTPASDKQLQFLGLQPMQALGLNRYVAACKLAWHFNQHGIRAKLEDAVKAAA